MPNPIKPKRSYTASNTPSLLSGEIGINAADGKMWIGNAAGTANVLISSLAFSDHTGTLGVASGGTGATTLTANNVILGNGTSSPTFVAPGASGNLLTSNGTTWQSTAPTAAAIPTGSLFPYAGSAAPTGYLLCQGQSVSSTNYLALHAVISNTYGGSAYTGASGLNFNLPDLRGRLPLGAGTGVGLNASGTGAPSGTAQTARTAGQWGGEETHLLTSAEMPQHNHTGVTGYMSANASHAHQNANVQGTSGGQYGLLDTGNAGSSGRPYVTSTNTDHYHTIPYDGSSSRHATMPPFVVLNFIIKT